MQRTIQNPTLMSDHDLIIRIDTKLSDLISDVGELKDVTSERITKLDMRVRALEKLSDESEPQKNIEKINLLYQWMIESKVSVRWMIIIASIIGSAFSFAVNIGVKYWLKI